MITVTIRPSLFLKFSGEQESNLLDILLPKETTYHTSTPRDTHYSLFFERIMVEATLVDTFKPQDSRNHAIHFLELLLVKLSG